MELFHKEMVGNASIMACAGSYIIDDLIRSVALRQNVSVIATKEAIKNVRFIFMVALLNHSRAHLVDETIFLQISDDFVKYPIDKGRTFGVLYSLLKSRYSFGDLLSLESLENHILQCTTSSWCPSWQ